MRYTKIVATIGPASRREGVLDQLILNGLDVARLNASHGDPTSLQAQLDDVRAASKRVGKDIAVLLDLGGPKLRVGEVEPGVELEQGTEYTLEAGDCVGDRRHACVSYGRLGQDLGPGDRVLIDDGRIQLLVRETHDGEVDTEVEVGGPLTSHKGVNVPGRRLSIDPITAKDRDDLAWGLAAGVDMVAMSFVRDPDDVRHLRALMGDDPRPIVTKIEKHEAIARLEEIVEEADAVMVARGDLGVETSPEQVPVIQKRIIEVCRGMGKPVIIATQMLESMTSAPRPTRAEASDVANAIFEGVDAVMLSGETAVGQYPVEALATMARIAETAEASMAEAGCVPWLGHKDVTRAVSGAACELAHDLDLAAIVSATQSGATARAVSRNRPKAPIVALTPNERVARQLRVVWGVNPVCVEPHVSLDDMLDDAVVQARQLGLAKTGDLVLITAGVNMNVTGATNLIQVQPVS